MASENHSQRGFWQRIQRPQALSAALKFTKDNGRLMCATLSAVFGFGWLHFHSLAVSDAEVFLAAIFVAWIASTIFYVILELKNWNRNQRGLYVLSAGILALLITHLSVEPLVNIFPFSISLSLICIWAVSNLPPAVRSRIRSCLRYHFGRIEVSGTEAFQDPEGGPRIGRLHESSGDE